MPLSPLASEIYRVLRDLVPNENAQITYQDLVYQLGPLPAPNQGLHWQDLRLNAALGELVEECRGQQLPAIPAIVVRSNELTPSYGYYSIAYPGRNYDDALADWVGEVQQVRQTTYPQTL